MGLHRKHRRAQRIYRRHRPIPVEEALEIRELALLRVAGPPPEDLRGIATGPGDVVTPDGRCVWREAHCWFCGVETTPPARTPGRPPPPTMRTREHLTPRSRGGRGQANVVRACLACNTQKGNRTLEEYRTAELLRGALTGTDGKFWGERVVPVQHFNDEGGEYGGED